MDNDLFFLIFNQAYKYPLLDKFMIFGAEQLIYIILIISLILALKDNGKKSFLYILISIPLAILLIKGIHLFYFIDRPFIAFNIKPLIDSFYGEASFPSRHMAAASSIYFSFLINKSKWASFFLILTIWVGIARVFVGVHYPIDILGGVVVGLVVVLSVKLFQKKMKI